MTLFEAPKLINTYQIENLLILWLGGILVAKQVKYNSVYFVYRVS